jgi:hypothetical protein
MNRFYTYAYLRVDRTPYYIGKGTDKRIHSTQHSVNLPPKNRRIFLKTGLSEEESIRHEQYMIGVYGRKDIGTGILRNRTDGSEGVSGRVVSEETKNKIGQSVKGRVVSEETKKKIGQSIKGRKRPDVTKRNRELNLGKKLSSETIDKMREKRGGKNNSNWKGGLYSEKTHAEYMREYRRRKRGAL